MLKYKDYLEKYINGSYYDHNIYHTLGQSFRDQDYWSFVEGWTALDSSHMAITVLPAITCYLTINEIIAYLPHPRALGITNGELWHMAKVIQFFEASRYLDCFFSNRGYNSMHFPELYVTVSTDYINIYDTFKNLICSMDLKSNKLSYYSPKINQLSNLNYQISGFLNYIKRTRLFKTLFGTKIKDFKGPKWTYHDLVSIKKKELNSRGIHNITKNIYDKYTIKYFKITNPFTLAWGDSQFLIKKNESIANSRKIVQNSLMKWRRQPILTRQIVAKNISKLNNQIDSFWQDAIEQAERYRGFYHSPDDIRHFKKVCQYYGMRANEALIHGRSRFHLDRLFKRIKLMWELRQQLNLAVLTWRGKNRWTTKNRWSNLRNRWFDVVQRFNRDAVYLQKMGYVFDKHNYSFLKYSNLGQKRKFFSKVKRRKFGRNTGFGLKKSRFKRIVGRDHWHLWKLLNRWKEWAIYMYFTNEKVKKRLAPHQRTLKHWSIKLKWATEDLLGLKVWRAYRYSSRSWIRWRIKKKVRKIFRRKFLPSIEKRHRMLTRNAHAFWYRDILLAGGDFRRKRFLSFLDIFIITGDKSIGKPTYEINKNNFITKVIPAKRRMKYTRIGRSHFMIPKKARKHINRVHWENWTGYTKEDFKWIFRSSMRPKKVLWMPTHITDLLSPPNPTPKMKRDKAKVIYISQHSWLKNNNKNYLYWYNPLSILSPSIRNKSDYYEVLPENYILLNPELNWEKYLSNYKDAPFSYYHYSPWLRFLLEKQIIFSELEENTRSRPLSYHFFDRNEIEENIPDCVAVAELPFDREAFFRKLAEAERAHIVEALRIKLKELGAYSFEPFSPQATIIKINAEKGISYVSPELQESFKKLCEQYPEQKRSDIWQMLKHLQDEKILNQVINSSDSVEDESLDELLESTDEKVNPVIVLQWPLIEYPEVDPASLIKRLMCDALFPLERNHLARLLVAKSHGDIPAKQSIDRISNEHPALYDALVKSIVEQGNTITMSEFFPLRPLPPEILEFAQIENWGFAAFNEFWRRLEDNLGLCARETRFIVNLLCGYDKVYGNNIDDWKEFCNMFRGELGSFEKTNRLYMDQLFADGTDTSFRWTNMLTMASFLRKYKSEAGLTECVPGLYPYNVIADTFLYENNSLSLLTLRFYHEFFQGKPDVFAGYKVLYDGAHETGYDLNSKYLKFIKRLDNLYFRFFKLCWEVIEDNYVYEGSAGLPPENSQYFETIKPACDRYEKYYNSLEDTRKNEERARMFDVIFYIWKVIPNRLLIREHSDLFSHIIKKVIYELHENSHFEVIQEDWRLKIALFVGWEIRNNNLTDPRYNSTINRIVKLYSQK